MAMGATTCLPLVGAEARALAAAGGVPVAGAAPGAGEVAEAAGGAAGAGACAAAYAVQLNIANMAISPLIRGRVFTLNRAILIARGSQDRH
jgi:hypothetical protein